MLMLRLSIYRWLVSSRIWPAYLLLLHQERGQCNT